MFALAESQPRPILKNVPKTLGVLIKPPEAIWNSPQEEKLKSPLQYMEGERLSGENEKVFIGWFGLETLKDGASSLVTITKDNFDECLGVTKERVAKFENLPWLYDETFRIEYPETEHKKREAIRKYLYGIYQEQDKKSEVEKKAQKDPVIIRVREINSAYDSVSDGRKYKIEFINLFGGHAVPPNIPPKELYTVSVILPAGLGRNEVFSLYGFGKPLNLFDEDMLIVEIPTDNNKSPMFDMALELFQKLSISQSGNVNNEQVEKTIFWITKKKEADCHPGQFFYEYQDPVTGLIYAKNWKGEIVPVARYFDNYKDYKDFKDNAQTPMKDANVGDVHVFSPVGGGISAGTSKNKPDQKNFQNFMVKGPDGKIYMFTDMNSLINFWQQNFPEVHLHLLTEHQRIKQREIPEMQRPFYRPEAVERNQILLPLREPRKIYDGFIRSREIESWRFDFQEDRPGLKIVEISPIFLFPSALMAEVVTEVLPVKMVNSQPEEIPARRSINQNLTAPIIEEKAADGISGIIYVDFTPQKPKPKISAEFKYLPSEEPDAPSGGGISNKEKSSREKTDRMEIKAETATEVTMVESKQTRLDQKVESAFSETHSQASHNDKQNEGVESVINMGIVSRSQSEGKTVSLKSKTPTSIKSVETVSGVDRTHNMAESAKEQKRQVQKIDRQTTSARVKKSHRKVFTASITSGEKIKNILPPQIASLLIFPPYIVQPEFGSIVDLRKRIRGEFIFPVQVEYWNSEGRMKEVLASALQAVNDSQIAYVMGLLFVVLINLINGRIILA